ncbi:alpha/beta hydrolase family protein [Streptomyces acidiscabies]|uniref:alpha/beta hydrolase family protein n=1 Tax=Streptomyces acidiscabies TaxID=42234 RepID=UPI00076EEC99|nr:hypothetical protein a10_03348 [Streptomyces acidiscabies]
MCEEATPLSRSRRIGVTAVAALAVLAGSPGLATAQEAPSAANMLPPGWRISGHDLLWRAPQPVPMGDARVEFHANGRLLGLPEQAADGRTFTLPLDDAAQAEQLTRLQVQSSGRRLDAEESGARSSLAAPQAAPALPVNPVDPGKPGPYRTTRGEYSLPSVKLPGFKVPVEMRGLVIAPKGAAGKRPVALFLHGRHSTCFKPGGGDDSATGDWPCAKGFKEIPSYQGYVKDQQLLASQGYVTVSISANGINGQDWEAEDAGAQARSSLVRRHLADWADWAAKPSSAPAVVRSAPKTDLSKVLLVGHSRGGEGVNRAAMDSLYPPPAAEDGAPGKARWHVSGTVLIGPTIFGQNPVADVPSATILPGCDGDVSDLQGEVYVDGTRGVSNGKALHSAVYVVGANHNYFNTEWTPGKAQAPAWDDFGSDPDHPDPICTPGKATRLTADQQHQVGSVYIAAAARLFVAGDDRVRPLLDGTSVRAASAGKAQVLTHAVGANRGAGFLPDGAVSVSGARLCDEVNADEKKGCGLDRAKGSSPHFAQWDTQRESGRRAVAVSWTKPGTAARITPAKALSLAGSSSVALRLFVPPNTRGTQFDVTLVDSANRRAGLGRVTVDGLPGSAQTASYWAREVRVPLKTARTFDLKRVKSLEITPRSKSGKAWLIDAWGWRAGTPAAQAAALPRVDVGRLTVLEGSSGTRTYRIPVKVSGKGSGQVRYYVLDPKSGTATDKVVTVRPGANAIDVPVMVKGDTRFGYDLQQDIVVKAVHGAVVGKYRGGVTAKNDDPEPKATLVPVADKVTEGGTLLWRVTQSETADVDIWHPIRLVPVTEGAELSTKDVDPKWLEDNSGQKPDPERPLSQADVWVWVVVEAGKTTADFDVRTVKDSVTEPVESVRAVLTDQDGKEIPGTGVTGTVTDAS